MLPCIFKPTHFYWVKDGVYTIYNSICILLVTSNFEKYHNENNKAAFMLKVKGSRHYSGHIF